MVCVWYAEDGVNLKKFSTAELQNSLNQSSEQIHCFLLRDFIIDTVKKRFLAFFTGIFETGLCQHSFCPLAPLLVALGLPVFCLSVTPMSFILLYLCPDLSYYPQPFHCCLASNIQLHKSYLHLDVTVRFDKIKLIFFFLLKERVANFSFK